jgi:hypothetical protein
MMRSLCLMFVYTVSWGCHTPDLSAGGDLSPCDTGCPPTAQCLNGFCVPFNGATADSGVVTDAGQTQADAGAELTDANNPALDASVGDSGTAVADAGPVVDAGGFIEGWQQRANLAGANSPGLLSETMMAYLPTRAQMVLFGGYKQESGRECEAKTYLWDGSAWSEHTGEAAPPARYKGRLVYDAARGELLLFGGGCSGQYFNDTWVWNGETWSEKTLSGAPPPRNDFAMGYDPVSERVIVFGGTQGSDRTRLLGDTWAWDGTGWAELSPASYPASERSMSLAYDAVDNNLVLWGGYQGSLIHYTWNGDDWASVSRGQPASGIYGQGADLVSYGTQGVAAFGWRFSNTLALGTSEGWYPLASGLTPSVRNNMALAYDSNRRELVMYGGILPNNNRLDDTWIWQVPEPNFPPGTLVTPSGDRVRCRSFENETCHGAQWHPGRANQFPLGCAMGDRWHDLTVDNGQAETICEAFCQLSNATPVVGCSTITEVENAAHGRADISAYLSSDNEGTACPLPEGHSVRMNGSSEALTQISVQCSW